MNNREYILKQLIKFDENFREAKSHLSVFPWDIEHPIVILTKNDLSNVLNKCLRGERSIDDLVEWSNMLESREDLAFETDELQEIIFDLANPEMHGDITKNKLEDALLSINK